jgi:hypothetical protein
MNNVPIGKGTMQTTLANEDLSALAAFSASLQPFKDLSSAGSPLPFSIIIAFLAVAQCDGAGAFQLGKDLGICRRGISAASSQSQRRRGPWPGRAAK